MTSTISLQRSNQLSYQAQLGPGHHVNGNIPVKDDFMK